MGACAPLAVLAALIGLAGCPGNGKPTPPTATQRVRVRSFSEPSPIRLLVSSSNYTFAAAESGLVRWDLASGDALELNAEHGLPGDRVEDMAYDRDRGWLWVATDVGLTRHDIEGGTFSEVPAPPSVLDIRSLVGTVLAPAGDGGVWLGHTKGLYYTNLDGEWTPTGVTDTVTSLLRTSDGALWIGTTKGLIGRRPDGETFRYGATLGCDLARVRFMASAPGGGPLIVGENSDGEQRIVMIPGPRCVSYRAAPGARWLSATRRGDELIILTSRSLYALRTPKPGARRLVRVGMRLLPVTVGEDEKRDEPGEAGATEDDAPQKSPYVIQSLDLKVPLGALVVSSSNEEVLLGTGDLGIARMTPGEQRVRWLRRGALVAGATNLSVACADRRECYVATGTRRAWRFDGKTFAATEHEDATLMAFARAAKGAIYSVESRGSDRVITLSRVSRGLFTPIEDLAVETPGAPRLTFAAFDAKRRLWLGLEYRDSGGDYRPFGVAVVDVGRKTVTYHRAARDDEEGAAPELPLPPEVASIAFQSSGAAWLATSEGAVRVIRDKELRVFGETDGVGNDRLHGIACAPDGTIYIGHKGGVESYDGDTWRPNSQLAFAVNDLTMGPDGRLWIATDRGLVRYDGATVIRLDTRRGLFENQIEDVTADHFGRIWARSPNGFTIVTP